MKRIGVDFNVQYLADMPDHFHSEIELLFLLSGTAEVTVGEDKFVMTENSVMIINCEKRHSLRVIHPGMLCKVDIDYQTISDYLGSDLFVFWCNSVADQQGDYTPLVKLIQKVIATRCSRGEAQDFGIYGLYYQLLDILIRKYLVDHNDARFKENTDESSERIHEIVCYVQRNYKQEISLNDLADKLFLSNAYLSRFFKKTFGQNFKDYVNSVRLLHAIDDLLSTEKNMTKVAMDNGFPSISRFNQVFKEVYKMAPLNYREAHLKEIEQNGSDETEQVLDDALMKDLSDYVYSQHLEGIDDGEEVKNVYIDTKNYRYIKKNWNRAINAGPMADLVRGQVQRDVLKVNRELQISYIRFWNIFDMVDFREGMQFNFSYFDRTVEFLLYNGMKPFIVLGGKERDIMINFDQKIFCESVDEGHLLDDPDLWGRLMTAFCRHLMTYFGAEEVSTWCFELRKPKEWDRFYDASTDVKFEKWFEIAVSILRQYFPNAMIGGCECVVSWRDDPDKELEDVIKLWQRIHFKPDFASITSFPYEKSKPSMNPDFLRDDILKAGKILARYGMMDIPLMVTEWCSTISNRNIYNEVCYKGAYMIQNLTMNMEYADKILYWNVSDVFGEFSDTSDLLYGGVGLFNKTGIAKPAFFALEFLGALYKYVVQCTRNYILTTDGNGNYRLLCNNLKNMNYIYCSNYEQDLNIQPKDYEMYFENMEKLSFRFHLQGMKDGVYLIRRREVSTEHGSIMDEVARWECSNELKHEDVEYLAKKCHPERMINKAECVNEILDLNVWLPANAFELIELDYQLPWEE